MGNIKLLGGLLLLNVFFSCNSSKELVKDVTDYEIELLDTLVVSAPAIDKDAKEDLVRLV